MRSWKKMPSPVGKAFVGRGKRPNRIIAPEAESRPREDMRMRAPDQSPDRVH
jgi:hypothetical protein